MKHPMIRVVVKEILLYSGSVDGAVVVAAGLFASAEEHDPASDH